MVKRKLKLRYLEQGKEKKNKYRKECSRAQCWRQTSINS